MLFHRLRKKSNRKKNKKIKLKALQRLSLSFFNRPRKTALIWLIVAVFGITSYGVLLKRDGFPGIDAPFAIANGTYLVNDPEKVDNQVAKPLSEFLLSQEGVKSVQAQSQANFFSVAVSYESDVSSRQKTDDLSSAIADNKILPEQAKIQFIPFELGFTERGDDLLVSIYSSGDATQEELSKRAEQAAEFFQSKNLPNVESVSPLNAFESAASVQNGQQQTAQKFFDRFGKKENGNINFYESSVVGFKARKDADKLALNDEVQKAVDELNSSPQFSGYNAVISASEAPNVRAQLSELQQVLLEGLLAILVVGSLLIAIRASILTVATMITVLAAVNAFLFLIGYSLNTITLFALILALALIIDDTIIMVEALDAQRRRHKKAKEAVKVATGKISRAMVAATLTAALSFAPLIFVTGILGEFIRAIPVTIISALLISLFVALIFTPTIGRFLLLRDGQMGSKNYSGKSARIEEKIAEFLARPMLWARNSKKRLMSVGLTAIFISFVFIGAGGFLFQKISFNIFPSSKDTNALMLTLNFPEQTSLDEAQKTADEANEIIKKVIGEDFDNASYYGQASARTAILTVNLTDYKERDRRAPEITDQLENEFKDFKSAQVNINQVDAGPPPSSFAARIDSSDNRAGAIKLAKDIAKHLSSEELVRTDGSVAKIQSVSTSNSDVYLRNDNVPYIEASASFEDTDTTTLVTLAQQAVEKEFPPERMADYSLSKDALSFSFGQEDENQESFRSLIFAFPAVLITIYLVLAFQFRSLLQPLLIFMAIPFSLFGITLGLYLTDNVFSFFAMLGFFALIGLSIKNTILLTDYANQARRAGMDAIDAAHAALGERFRPLIATSLTAVVSLIPLAVTSPFWEGLTVVLIFGLLSSTFLVITVFPYYYLGSEFMRTRISRKIGLAWIVLSIIAAALLSMAALPVAAAFAPIATAFSITVFERTRKKKV